MRFPISSEGGANNTFLYEWSWIKNILHFHLSISKVALN